LSSKLDVHELKQRNGCESAIAIGENISRKLLMNTDEVRGEER